MAGLHLLLVCLCVLDRALAQNASLFQLTDPLDHGEGPTWDPRTKLLYFVDIFGGRLLSYDPAMKAVSGIALQGTLTPVVPAKASPSLFVLGLNRSVVAVEWDGKEKIGATRTLTEVSPQFPTSRLNDGKADKKGRLWFGTMGLESAEGVVPNQGVLYFITKDNLDAPVAVLHPVNVSNGLAWNKADDKFFYIDTPTRRVVQYDFDSASGQLSNPKVAFDLANYDVPGFPDGMTIDKDDNLWIALYNGGAVIKVSPATGEILQLVGVPAPLVTSVAWGGEQLDTLYVTTSRHNMKPEDVAKHPASGALFAIKDLATSGLPAYEADVVADLK